MDADIRRDRISGADPNPVKQTIRCLRRVDDGTVVAIADGDLYIRTLDQKTWARSSGDELLACDSGRCLAFRVGKFFYDPATNEPLYYDGVF